MAGEQLYDIHRRTLYEVNTDPQRRCYWGVHARSELRWGPWEVVDVGLTDAKAEHTLTFWRDLNDYAVNARGKANTQSEYKKVPHVGAITGGNQHGGL